MRECSAGTDATAGQFVLVTNGTQEEVKSQNCAGCAGTGMCVHIPFRLNPIPSLAWLGTQLPCTLLNELEVNQKSTDSL